ncbi:hypothetical protein L2E82_24934 [Cichorium intybus]|uniref:Uncharacterized protein n=1 Tax=Cichorium intybus TaxID=13427 RepID=A0ACB9E2M2_CICIN|nr:hypothetical protein L2E82_24934 [Cichorium intybus]
MDELAPSNHVGTVLFFSANKDDNPKFVARLEKSLEKTLTRYYPLAGRYVQEMRAVDCSDQGAEFIYSKADMSLQDILDSQWDAKFVDELIPSIMLGGADEITYPILAIQVNTLLCGDVGLGVSISHRLADASTLCTFLNEWAVMNREDNEVELTGTGFSIPPLFPGRDLPPHKIAPCNIVTKKLSFSESEIADMKVQFMINEKDGPQYLSKVQIVSAIIWKALINVDRATRSQPRDSFLLQLLNLRGRSASLIPKDSCGNLVAPFPTKSSNDETIQGWCKFPFYEADFGFGKPICVTMGSAPRKNVVYLLDGMGCKGVDAYVFAQEDFVLRGALPLPSSPVSLPLAEVSTSHCLASATLVFLLTR